MGDSGATRTLLTEDTAKHLQLKEWDPRVELEVEYGGGEEVKYLRWQDWERLKLWWFLS